jgi:hypothetical protein
VIEYIEPMRTIVVVGAFCHGSSSYEGELPQISMLLHDWGDSKDEDFDGVGLGLWCNVRIEHKQTSSSIWASQFRHGLLLVNSLVDNAHDYSQSLILLSRSDDLDTERGAQVYCPVHHLLVP